MQPEDLVAISLFALACCFLVPGYRCLSITLVLAGAMSFVTAELDPPARMFTNLAICIAEFGIFLWVNLKFRSWPSVPLIFFILAAFMAHLIWFLGSQSIAAYRAYIFFLNAQYVLSCLLLGVAGVVERYRVYRERHGPDWRSRDLRTHGH